MTRQLPQKSNSTTMPVPVEAEGAGMPEVFAVDPQARAMFEQHEKFCKEREENHQRHHRETLDRVDALSAKLSSGVTRLHERMDDADTKRGELVTAFTQEIAKLTIEHTRTSTRQGIIVGAAVFLGTTIGGAIIAAAVKGWLA